jgi:N-hydroxyarylamine O-acetyltransferase
VNVTDWGVGELDLDAYLRRIGVTDPTLHNIHAAHVDRIPFENITVVLGETPRLDLPGIQAKLVHRRRGGYCYEHNLLYSAALERLGIPVTRLAARSAVGTDRIRPRTHMMLLATVDGERWLTDVGWGVGGFLEPIPLEEGPVKQGVWTYRLVREDDLWLLQLRSGDGWDNMYRFAIEHTYPADYEMANHYTATWPHSAFRQRLVAQRPAPTNRLKLTGNVLTVTHPDGMTEERTLGREELLASLTDDFGIELNDEERAGLPIG